MEWNQVSPDAHPFDAKRAKEIISELVKASRPKGPANRQVALEGLTKKLVGEFGPWIELWTWSSSEPGGGGPVRPWCCADHSYFPNLSEDETATVKLVIESVLDLRKFYTELRDLFSEIDIAMAEFSTADRIEYAAAALVPYVVNRTDAEDMWYATYQECLKWYLESRGENVGNHDNIIYQKISGRFESWVAPSEETVLKVSAELGEALGKEIDRVTQPLDVIPIWHEMRDKPVTLEARPNRTVHEDSHIRFIENVDHERDPDRAARMFVALEHIRKAACESRELDFNLLKECQALVLQRPAEFRKGDAFAKGGRELYKIETNTQRDFEIALRQAGDTSTALEVRAARVFLDICFFHPFEDGNGRAARLAMDYVLTRAGKALYSVGPIYGAAHPCVPECLAMLAQTVVELAGPRN